jgi:hypothetical protein
MTGVFCGPTNATARLVDDGGIEGLSASLITHVEVDTVSASVEACAQIADQFIKRYWHVRMYVFAPGPVRGDLQHARQPRARV